MRVYITMSNEAALKVLAEGFWDMHTDMGFDGVWCEDRPRGSDSFISAIGGGVEMRGPDGDTTLCIEVPDDVFHDREPEVATRPLTKEEEKQWAEGDTRLQGVEFMRDGYAILPAEVLNSFGKPQVYGHYFAGASKRELLTSIKAWEEADTDGTSTPHINHMKAAIEFFDKIGWLTPLRLREEAPDDYRKPDKPPFGMDIEISDD